MINTLIGLVRGSKWDETFVANMRIMIGDSEYQIGWCRKLDDPGKPKQEDKRDDETREKFNDLLGNLIKFCIKHAANHYNLMNPNLKDIDSNTVYIKSISSHRITPVFATSTVSDGIKTVIGYSPKLIVNKLYVDSYDKILCKLFTFNARQWEEFKYSRDYVIEEVNKLKETLTNSSSNTSSKVIVSTKLSSAAMDAKKVKISFDEVIHAYVSSRSTRRRIALGAACRA